MEAAIELPYSVSSALSAIFAQRSLSAARAAAEAAFAPAGEKVPDAPKEWPFGTTLAVPAERPDLSSLTPLDYLLSVVRDSEAF